MYKILLVLCFFLAACGPLPPGFTANKATATIKKSDPPKAAAQPSTTATRTTAASKTYLSPTASTCTVSEDETGGDTLNIRRGPGMDQEIIKSLFPGTSCKILEARGDWYRVSTNGLTGWINSKFCK